MGKGTSCTSLTTWLDYQNPHKKWGTVAYISAPSTTTVRWDVETELPRIPGGCSTAAETRQSPSQPCGRQGPALRRSPLMSSCTLWHMCTLQTNSNEMDSNRKRLQVLTCSFHTCVQRQAHPQTHRYTPVLVSLSIHNIKRFTFHRYSQTF